MKKHLLFVVFIALIVNFTALSQVPARKGWWKFDDPADMLKAEIGKPLELMGSQKSVDGPVAGNKAAQIDPGSYLSMTHGMAANGLGTTVNEYSLQIDFSVPETGIWHAFFQTDPTNSGDADLFTNTTNSVGVAETGYSSKGIVANAWYRMIVTVKNGEFFKIYMDGALWLDGSVRPIDGRFGLLSTLLLFADNDGEDGSIQCSELGIWNVALDASQVLSLGGANSQRVPVRTKLGWWKFDDPANLLKAEVGSPLKLVGTQQSVDGPVTGNKASKIDVGSYLKMTNGLFPNGGGKLVNEYSLQIDFLIPEGGKWHSFFQTDPTNVSDADLFVDTSNAIGVAAIGYTDNAILPATWYRMVVTVKNGQFFKVYINGEIWLDKTGQDVDGRFALANELLLFADNDGEDGAILCSELAVWEVALSETEVADLGASPTVQIPDRMGQWKFDDPANIGKATIGYNLAVNGTITSVSGPSAGNKAASVGVGSYFKMLDGIYSNGGGMMINDYTLQIDFSIPEAGIWHAFFQTDPTNTSDADLFANKSNAIGTAATTYSTKTISANTWYRMVVTVRNGSFFRIYMNGEIWLDAAGQPIDGRFALASELLLFGDEDGDDGLINCAEVSIWEVALTADQVAKLGNATTIPTGIEQVKLPDDITELGQNYPNPFTNSTIFPYQISQTENVRFRVIDVAGNEVRMINEGVKSPGKYSLGLSSEKLKNGIYYLQMITDKQVITRKMVFIH